MQEKVTLELLAKETGLSSSRFSHLFREETGESPMEYLRKEKIEASKNLLLYSERKIYEISEILGFSNESHFIKVFKEMEGITPTNYRKISVA